MTDAEPVLLERGRRWTFASALHWPGWSRRAKGGDEDALSALQDYEERYRLAVAPAGIGFVPGVLTVTAAVTGTATTDFGAPDVPGPEEDSPDGADEAARLTELLDACWQAFDRVVAAAPPELRKGPRGGGRDRDAVTDHVREAERSYTRTVGVRVPPRTPWLEQRAAILGGVRAVPGDATPTSWPVRYYVRRAAWHVLDHAWEIEDRSPGA